MSRYFISFLTSSSLLDTTTNTPGAIPSTKSTTPYLLSIPPSSFRLNTFGTSFTSPFIPCAPLTSGIYPVEFDITANSTIVLLPSLNEASICALTPLLSASSATVSGLQSLSILLFFPFPITLTSNPAAFAKSYNSFVAAGSSPAAPV